MKHVSKLATLSRNHSSMRAWRHLLRPLAQASRLLVACVVFGSGTLAALANDIANFTTVFRTDWTSAGTGGMRNTGVGTITLAGVSGTVTKAYLYWHGPMNSTNPSANQTVNVDGTDVTGTPIGLSDNNCWGFLVSQAYRADVTALVAAKGNGAYALSNFIKAGNINVNGASLIVFFDDGNAANNRDVVIFDGNDSNVNNIYDADGWNVTLAGIIYTNGTAKMQLHVADGQSFNDAPLILNATVLDAGPAIFQGTTLPGGPGPAGNGNLWDIKSYVVTSFLSPGTNTLTLTSSVNNDCMSFIVALIDLPAGAAPPTNNNTPPFAICCTNVVVSAGTNCVAQASIDCGSFDPDGDTITLTQIPPGPYPLGSNNVCLIVSDGKASNVCCSVVNVVDTTPPRIQCPGDITVTNNPGQCSGQATFAVSAFDDCSIASLDCDNPSGSIFPPGVTTVNCTAVDRAGNTNTCSFTVTVLDRQAPLVACRPGTNPSGDNIPVAGKNPASGQNPDGFYQLLAEDNCDPNPTIYVMDSASPFVAGPFANGDLIKLTQSPGHTSQDAAPPPVVAHVHLKGDALVYAVDAAGNTGAAVSCNVPPLPK